MRHLLCPMCRQPGRVLPASGLDAGNTRPGCRHIGHRRWRIRSDATPRTV